MKTKKYTEIEFQDLVRSIYDQTKPLTNRFLRAEYGASLQAIAACWKICKIRKDSPTLPEHLSWNFKFLKTYKTESLLAADFRVSRKTFRKWLWKTLRMIADCYVKMVRSLFINIYMLK